MRPSRRLVMLSTATLIAAPALTQRPAVRRPTAAAPALIQKVTGPVATYWASAATTNGSGFGAMGGGGTGARPSMGDMMRMMRGGSRTDHALTLQLGSTRAATGEPKADHFPAALAALPLVTPRAAPTVAPVPEETTEDQPTMPDRPKGRLLLFWGCGEHAGAGQPQIIDFSKIGVGMPLPRLPFVAIRHQNPPAPGRFTTYGEWPNSTSQRLRQQPPATLVGGHSVRGTYSPDIQFTLPPGKDYLPPLIATASDKTPAGATRLAWQPVAGSLGYFATLFGASAGGAGGAGGADIVIWSSSAVAVFAGGGLLDYLAPGEVRRLIGQQLIMPPSQTECLIPAEVASAAPVGLLSMIAYGDETDFADPPRPADPRTPWNINWTVKVRTKSTTGLMLGMPGMGAGAAGREQSQPNATPAPRRGGGLLNRLKDLSDAVPR